MSRLGDYTKSQTGLSNTKWIALPKLMNNREAEQL